MSKQYTPTPEHLALAAERRAKKQKKVETSTQKNEVSGTILLREWLQLNASHIGAIKILTWNVCAFSLAQDIHQMIQLIYMASCSRNVLFVSNEGGNSITVLMQSKDASSSRQVTV
jgi:hypothetical protein